MHHHIQVIQKNPSALTITLHSNWPVAFLFQTLLDKLGDALNLNYIQTATDYEVIGDDQPFFNIQNENVFGLFLQSRSSYLYG